MHRDGPTRATFDEWQERRTAPLVNSRQALRACRAATQRAAVSAHAARERALAARQRALAAGERAAQLVAATACLARRRPSSLA